MASAVPCCQGRPTRVACYSRLQVEEIRARLESEREAAERRREAEELERRERREAMVREKGLATGHGGSCPDLTLLRARTVEDKGRQAVRVSPLVSFMVCICISLLFLGE